MSFATLTRQDDAVELLERSLARGRIGHAYLFSGEDIEKLELVARTLAKALNCQQPGSNPRVPGAPDSCDVCPTCRRIDQGTHPDVQWVRPESKSRVILIEQMRTLMQTVFLKPTEARCKVAVIVAADRLNTQAANSFLKTLEEPPPRSVLILLSTDPGRLLETILSRCLRLNFSGEGARFQEPAFLDWLKQFTKTAVAEGGSVLSRYRLLSVLLSRLNAVRETISADLAARYLDPKLREKWEDELEAAIEAEYRRQRSDLLTGIQLWMRDVWLLNLERHGHAVPSADRTEDSLLGFPQFSGATRAVAARISMPDALENLRVVEHAQRLLASNVQEGLSLEVALLKLKL